MSSPETVRGQRELADQGYIADAAISMSLHLARSLRKPLLVEGPAGVGKTEIAKVLASILGTDLIRLQCYEGFDTSTALYEWNYQPQLLQIRMEEEEKGRSLEQKEAHIFSEAFLLKRPLLQAITHHRRPYCSSMNSTGPMKSLRVSSSKFSPTGRSAYPSWAPSRRPISLRNRNGQSHA